MRQRITIVGTGSQDGRLLTLLAVDALAAAGAVIADAELETLACQFATGEVVPVAGASLAQRTRAVRDALKRHQQVVRLIAGDPVWDGVLAQELQALQALGQLTVIPGVSSTTVAATYAGVSLTGQQIREVRVVDAADPSTVWSMAPRETLVVKGAGGATPRALAALRAAGNPPSTPFRVVRNAGSVQQCTITGELADFESIVDVKLLGPDSTVFLGEPVRSAVEWFEQLPLLGWRVLMPRTKDALGELTQALELDGAVTTHVPTLSVEAPRTPQQIERAVTGLVEGRFGWVVFTCANAFTAVWDKCREYGLDARVFAGTRVAAVGEDTVAALAARGMFAELVHTHTTQGLLDGFPVAEEGDEVMSRVLIPRAEIATETLAAGLAALGWETEEVTVFRTVRSAPPAASTREAIKTGRFDAVVFTSSATVRNLIGLAGKPHASTVVACIGPSTARTAEEHGLRVDVVASTPTHAALAEALVDFALARREAEASPAQPAAVRTPVSAPKATPNGRRKVK
ncbi:MAG: uroporphyrinogen-III synthase [Candidatus Nanopelagicales bacterium]